MSVTAILFVLLLFISMYTQIKQHTLWLMMFVGRFYWLISWSHEYIYYYYYDCDYGYDYDYYYYYFLTLGRYIPEGFKTRGQSNLTKSASVRGHTRGSKVVPLNSWGRVSY